MRNISEAFAAALGGDILYPIFFYEAEFANGTMNLWTGFGDRVWDGKTWTGIGWLIGISEVEETTDTQATSLTIGLQANQQVVSAALQSIRRNKPMTIWMGLLSDGGGDVAKGELIDVQQIFSGLCDISEVDVDPANPAVRIKYSNKLADLERARVRRQTDADQKIDFPEDRGFEYVGALSDAVLPWGNNG
ncbi:MAG: hypothetical protein JSR47_24920 [Proteobacteria bacterium]|nr:hypothetical protein [Pseudomonadota bacterium]